MDNKLGQDRSRSSRAYEWANLSGRVQERMNPELRKSMNEMRAADKKIRKATQAAKSDLRTARSSTRRREYLSAASALADFHSSCKTVSGILSDFTKSVNMQGYDYLINNERDSSRRDRLFEYNPRTPYLKETEAALEFEAMISNAGIGDSLRSLKDWTSDTGSNLFTGKGWARRRMESNSPSSFLRKTADRTRELLSEAETMLATLLEVFGGLESALSGRNVEGYTQEAKRFTDAFGQYNKKYIKYYNDIVVPLREHAKKQDAEQMPMPSAPPGLGGAGPASPAAPSTPGASSAPSADTESWSNPDLRPGRSAPSVKTDLEAPEKPTKPFTGFDMESFPPARLSPGNPPGPKEPTIDPPPPPPVPDTPKALLALPPKPPEPKPEPIVPELDLKKKPIITPPPPGLEPVEEIPKVPELPIKPTSDKKKRPSRKKAPAATATASSVELGKVAMNFFDSDDLAQLEDPEDETEIDSYRRPNPLIPSDLGPKALKRRQERSFFADLEDKTEENELKRKKLEFLRSMKPNTTDKERNESILQAMEELYGDKVTEFEPDEEEWFTKGDSLEDLEASFMDRMSKLAAAEDADSMLDTIMAYAERIEDSNPSGSLYLTKIASLLHEEKTAGIFSKKKDLNRPIAESYKGKDFPDFQDDRLGKKKLDIGIGPINQPFSSIKELDGNRIKITAAAHHKIMMTIVNRLAKEEDDRSRLRQFANEINRKLADELRYAILNGVVLSGHDTKHDHNNPNDRVLSLYTRLDLSKFDDELNGIGQVLVQCRVSANTGIISVNNINANFKVIEIEDDEVEEEDDDEDIVIEDYDYDDNERDY